MPKPIKTGAYVINLEEYPDVGTHWITLYANNSGTEHVAKEIKRFIGHKDIKTKTFRIQANNSIMCGYFCIGFKDFMFAGKHLIFYQLFFSL